MNNLFFKINLTIIFSKLINESIKMCQSHQDTTLNITIKIINSR